LVFGSLSLVFWDKYQIIILRDFRKLEVWHEAITLVEFIYKLTNEFPISEKFNLISQMQRCSFSIPSNLAEGASRDSSIEFSRYLQIAIGSSFELETQLIISNRLGYIKESEHILERINKLQRRLNALNKSIK